MYFIKKKTFSKYVIMLTLNGICCFFLLLSPVRNFIKQIKNIDKLENQVYSAQNEFNKAKNINEKWANNDIYKKEQARIRLLYSMPNETIYIVLEDDSKKVNNYNNIFENCKKLYWHKMFMESYYKADK